MRQPPAAAAGVAETGLHAVAAHGVQVDAELGIQVFPTYSQGDFDTTPLDQAAAIAGGYSSTLMNCFGRCR